MKKLSLIVPILLFIGCGNTPSTSSTTHYKQHSISQQKLNAQNAWDELDGKKILVNNHTKNYTNTTKKTIKTHLEHSNSIPDWFYSPPKSDRYFYGAGEGSNPKQSQISALDSISREIQTTISSNTSISEGYNGSSQNFYKNVQNNITSQVQQIKFTNIEVMKTVKVQNNIYTLVRIDKQKLFNSLKTEFITLDSEITNDIQESKKYSLLDQLITINKLQSKIKKAISLANILNSLNPNFNPQPYLSKYNNYINQKNKILHQLSFSVTPNDIFAQKLIEILNQNGYKVSNHSNIIIKLSKQIRNSNTMGLAVSRITINIQTIAKNKILSSFSIEVKGISNTYKQAIAKASINFKQKLQKKGINKLLGLE